MRRIFHTEKKARNWETKVLRRIKSVKSERWLNKTDNIAIAPMPGENNGMYGKTHSQEVKDFISKNNKGRILSEEARKKISMIHKGRVFSKQHIERLSISKKGKNNPMYGKPKSEECKQKMSDSLKGEKSYWFGKHHSEETIQKLREVNLGKNQSEETKRKRSKALNRKT